MTDATVGSDDWSGFSNSRLLAISARVNAICPMRAPPTQIGSINPYGRWNTSWSDGFTGQPKGTGEDNTAARAIFRNRTNPAAFANQASPRLRLASGANNSAMMPETTSQLDPLHVIELGITPSRAQPWRITSSGRRKPWKANSQPIEKPFAIHRPTRERPIQRLTAFTSPKNTRRRGIGLAATHPLQITRDTTAVHPKAPIKTPPDRRRGLTESNIALLHTAQSSANTMNKHIESNASNEGIEAS